MYGGGLAEMVLNSLPSRLVAAFDAMLVKSDGRSERVVVE